MNPETPQLGLDLPVNPDHVDEEANTSHNLENNQVFTIPNDSAELKTHNDLTDPYTFQYFTYIPNEMLGPPDKYFRKGTIAFRMYTYIIECKEAGIEPDRDLIFERGFDKPFNLTIYYQKRNYMESKIRIINERDKLDTPLKNPQPLPDAAINNSQNPPFPVFETPKNRKTGIKQPAPPLNDNFLKTRIAGLENVQFAATKSIFDRIAGNSLSEQAWLKSISESTGIPVTSIDLRSVIHEINEDIGMKIVSYISDGVRYYFRRKYD